MKLIHCADLHLDARMTANLDKDKAKERRDEILHTFVRMVDYATGHDVSAILIAGDFFDTKNVSAKTRNEVLHQIQGAPGIAFYYLKGNHDQDNFISGLPEIPPNLRLFGDGWKSYEEGCVTISGIELSGKNRGSLASSIILDAGKFNIVMLHGQDAGHAGGGKSDEIPLGELRNKGIDYLALGHVHGYKIEKLDARGIYCYPGCLEGRGFDESGEHGFVLLDIDEDKRSFTHEFIPFAARTIRVVTADVSGCMTTAAMAVKIEEALKKAGCHRKDLIKIILSGETNAECEKDVTALTNRFAGQYYFVKTEDETRYGINEADYINDKSLKGEFVRMAMADESMKEEERNVIIRYGILALAGEEI